MIRLYENNDECCACGACLNVCPKNAISMKENKYGFLFPEIDSKLCIDCHMCKKVCAFQNITETNIPLSTWAAVSKDKERLKNSASGGIFYTLANEVIRQGGCAVGAAFDDGFNVRHIIADDAESLRKLQGSKYTQSNTGHIYREIKKRLKNNEMILFSGCACQVAGLKAFLGKEYDNLITVDLICHGVPSNASFKDYLKVLENKKNVSIKDFSFRDKKYGWGENGTAFTSHGKRIKALYYSSSYIYYFLQGFINRDNCCKCKYAGSNRPGDITIGDFWGIEREHPEYIGKSGIDISSGVSVIIANTRKGLDTVEKYRGVLELYESSFEKASHENEQLNHPIEDKPERKEILELYAESGWEAVDKRFNKNIGLKRYRGYITSMLPAKFKMKLKKLLR